MKYKNIIKVITVVFFLSFLIFNFNFINAQEPTPDSNYAPLKGLETVAKDQAGFAAVDKNSARDITAGIIKTILGFLGIIFLILIISGGYQWMTSAGNEETIGKAKKRIINATIGVVIVILSYAISYFIMGIIYVSS